MNNEILDLYSIRDNFQIYNHVKSIKISTSRLTYKPIVTIAIPTFKRSKFLKESIDSALGQIGFDQFDILIVDNDPTRNCDTEELVSSYDSPKINYFKNEINIGMTANWNKLFVLAEGIYVTMLHDDDLLLPTFLQDCMREINKDSTIGIVKPLSKIFYDLNSLKSNSPKENVIYKFKHLERLYDFSNYSSFQLGAPTGCVFKKSYVINIGGFNDKYYPTQDLSFIILFSYLYKVYKLNKVLFLYRINNNESLKEETLKGFVVNNYFIRRALLKTYKVPEYFASLYLSFLTVGYVKFLKKNFNSLFDFDFNNLSIKKEKQISVFISRVYVIIHMYILKVIYQFKYLWPIKFGVK